MSQRCCEAVASRSLFATGCWEWSPVSGAFNAPLPESRDSQTCCPAGMDTWAMTGCMVIVGVGGIMTGGRLRFVPGSDQRRQGSPMDTASIGCAAPMVTEGESGRNAGIQRGRCPPLRQWKAGQRAAHDAKSPGDRSRGPDRRPPDRIRPRPLRSQAGHSIHPDAGALGTGANRVAFPDTRTTRASGCSLFVPRLCCQFCPCHCLPG